MNVQVGAEAALFPEKENIKGLFVAVYLSRRSLSIITLRVEHKDPRDQGEQDSGRAGAGLDTSMKGLMWHLNPNFLTFK